MTLSAASSRLIALTDRSVLRVTGANAAHFLQGICTQDVPAALERPAQSRASPAAFLSPRGKVLADVILLPRDETEVWVDVHSSIAKNLYRLLMRHRLREPLKIEDVSSDLQVFGQLPTAAVSGSSGDSPTELPEGFFEDPRYAAIGARAILETSEGASLQASGSLDSYHAWRVCCGVPEGPGDLEIDETIPLHANLDFLNFISFNKGCYTGQELTTRTKHRGAVRKRFFQLLASDVDFDCSSSSSSRHLPIPLELALGTSGTALPGGRPQAAEVPSAEERAVMATKPKKDPSSCGTLHSVCGPVGLGILRVDGLMNNREDLVAKPDVFKAGTTLSTADGTPLTLRLPPYVFSE
eukprot:CAMPEP_0206430046 /NCGR_PEP_ID=MMETSP0324_2-20121206/6588_1 /ASSEMBLY_ACC=CAM_ASM_000836 /TAXON_ID=2866 /ORGANISM="Crypthecodinium cohnii, Strain Seligo" /LENGTH=353 /DNA_ID=CAMNT_0053895813 /DNA_START=35 /DNA_END=1096 /DNA_ORIENTATION=+